MYGIKESQLILGMIFVRFSLLLIAIIWPISLGFNITAQAQIGGFIAEQAPKLISAHQDLVRGRVAFDIRIEAARASYFNEKNGPAQKEKARKEFAELLYAKDLVYLSSLLAWGPNENSWNTIKAVYLLSGREPDGGIAPVALTEFNEWVRSVRRFAGAQRDGQFAIITDPATLQQALTAASPQYRAYLAKRDAYEIQKIINAKKKVELLARVNAAKSADGTPSFYDHIISDLKTFDWFLPGINGDNKDKIDRLMYEAKSNGQKIISCRYGPEINDKDEEVFSSFLYWYESAPAEMREIISLDITRKVSHYGEVGIVKCPSTYAQSKRLKQETLARYPAATYTVTPAPRPIRKNTGHGSQSTQSPDRLKELGRHLPNIQMGHGRKRRR